MPIERWNLITYKNFLSTNNCSDYCKYSITFQRQIQANSEKNGMKNIHALMEESQSFLYLASICGCKSVYGLGSSL
jgi:hypothetical protein